MFPYLIKVGMKGRGDTDVRGDMRGNRVQERGNGGGGGRTKKPKAVEIQKDKGMEKNKRRKREWGNELIKGEC
jgi:hypothetical protein